MVSPAALPLHVLRLGAAALLLGLAVAADLAPLTHGSAGWTVPDLLLCVVACIVGRRPRMLPAPLILAAGLVRDLLSGAPPGPGAAALLLGGEHLRAARPATGPRGFASAWISFAAVAAGTVLLPAALLWITFVAVPDAGSLAMRWAVTVAAYPLVLALLPVGRDGAPGRPLARERAA